MSRIFQWDPAIIYPGDPTASAKRIQQYEKYYRVKFEICKAAEPKRIAEIGVRCGYSAWAFLQAAPEAEYVGFDANNGKHGGQGGQGGSFWKWANQLLSGDRVTLIEQDTQKIDSLPLKDIDFFHIDGDHSMDGVMHDLDLAYNTLSRYGQILVDDVDYIVPVLLGVRIWTKKMEKKIATVYYESLRGEMVIYKR